MGKEGQKTNVTRDSYRYINDVAIVRKMYSQ